MGQSSLDLCRARSSSSSNLSHLEAVVYSCEIDCGFNVNIPGPVDPVRSCAESSCAESLCRELKPSVIAFSMLLLGLRKR